MDKIMFEKLMRDAGFELKRKTDNQWEYERIQSVVNCRLDEEFVLWIFAESGYRDVLTEFNLSEMTVAVSCLFKACLNEEIQKQEQTKPAKRKWWPVKYHQS